MVTGMEGMSLEDQLRTLGLSNVGKSGLRGNFIAVYSFLNSKSAEGGAELQSLRSSDRTYGNGSKLNRGRFRLDIRKYLFNRRVFKRWNKFSREVVDALNLSVFKRHMDNAFNNRLYLGAAIGLDYHCRSCPTEITYSILFHA